MGGEGKDGGTCVMRGGSSLEGLVGMVGRGF